MHMSDMTGPLERGSAACRADGSTRRNWRADEKPIRSATLSIWSLEPMMSSRGNAIRMRFI